MASIETEADAVNHVEETGEHLVLRNPDAHDNRSVVISAVDGTATVFLAFDNGDTRYFTEWGEPDSPNRDLDASEIEASDADPLADAREVGEQDFQMLFLADALAGG